MQALRTNALVVFLALSCTSASPASSSASAPRGLGATPQDEQDGTDSTTLRFGDPEGAYDAPFFPGATYDDALPTPDAFLGQQHGSRLAHHAEIVSAFRAWAELSDRVTVQTYGRTHEGRELIYAVITSPENHARLDDVLGGLDRLYDPRGLSDAAADAIIANSPAVAWLGYSIHGDELSGADASLAVAHHLIAGTGDDVAELLTNVVVVMDPCMNPDGRERIIGMVEQSAGYTPNLDYASMQRGRWPYGRGNHYLFDMNRDWMAGTQPETRGRWAVAQRFHPQLFVDAHEMGSLDTFLFYPQNAPVNPNLPTWLIEWQRKYAEDAAKAFDQRGWSYYSREWADAWAPFYSDAWGSLHGATGMLYEQAGIAGFPLRRRSGEVLNYREAVHHQAVASIANVTTLAANREGALRAFLSDKRRNVSKETPGNDRMLVVLDEENGGRIRRLRRILDGQGIEYAVNAQTAEVKNATNTLGETIDILSVGVGAIVVRLDQPMGQMAAAYLGFDHRMSHDDLVRERADLEQKNSSRIYDTTSWSLPLALDLEAYWCDAKDLETKTPPPMVDEPMIGYDTPAVTWIVSGAEDAALAFAVRAMESGLAVNVSDTPVLLASPDDPGSDLDGAVHEFPRGTLLVRAIENEGDVEAKVLEAARAAGVHVHGAPTGLTPDKTSTESPDLGGGHFTLLARPRVAILANAPVSSDRFGHLWHYLDTELGVPFSQLDAHSLGSYDLRRYNVLILPPGRLDAILEESKDQLDAWVSGGGTLIAMASSAAALTSGRLGLSSVTLRADALEDLSPYLLAAQRERGAQAIEIDDAQVWGDAKPEPEPEPENEASDEDADDPYAAYDAVEIPADHDRWLRRFAPFGATLRGSVDPNAWLTYGADGDLPLFFTGSNVFLSKAPVRTAIRLAPAETLRVSGLVWPEARERIADSAYATVERKGNGQIVLFATMPGFRGYHHATARFFGNAVVLGPGVGADQPSDW